MHDDTGLSEANSLDKATEQGNKRELSVLVPAFHLPSKGRNVYYSPTDLLALTVMEYLLSMGLSFEVCQEMLETLKATESWLFQPSVLEEQMKRFMLLLD